VIERPITDSQAVAPGEEVITPAAGVGLGPVLVRSDKAADAEPPLLASPPRFEALAARIEALTGQPDPPEAAVRTVVSELFDSLEAGEVRAAERTLEGWRVNTWVKLGILLAFRAGEIAEFARTGPFVYSDKDTLLPPRQPPAGVRVVPGGSAARRGSYLAAGVVVMPPAYINVGAYVGTGSMVDSHALVGSCAQVGAHVHLSAAVQIGGVLEPAGARPVIIEDEAFVGAMSGVFEGVLVRRRAVLAPGVVLTASTPLFDLPRGTIHRGSPEEPVAVPEGAVVVHGGRPARGQFARREALMLYAPVIVKYRDEHTDAATALEAALH
jgi:2,3,4,5-tetrahydropyridine-2-carboxylate N-succinyltransferase